MPFCRYSYHATGNLFLNPVWCYGILDWVQVWNQVFSCQFRFLFISITGAKTYLNILQANRIKSLEGNDGATCTSFLCHVQHVFLQSWTCSSPPPVLFSPLSHRKVFLRSGRWWFVTVTPQTPRPLQTTVPAKENGWGTYGLPLCLYLFSSSSFSSPFSFPS